MDRRQLRNDRLSNLSLVEMFELQVEKAPDAPAIWHDGQVLTYRELQNYSINVAAQISNVALKPDSVIGIYIERGFSVAASIIGALRSGVAFTPLSPAVPLSRLATQVKQCDMALILYSNKVHAPPLSLSNIAEFLNVYLRYDTAQSKIYSPNTFPLNKHSADSLAYVMFTSGTSGIPKGVMVSRGALENKISSLLDYFEIKGSLNFAVTSDPSFDPFLEQLFLPLCSGGCAKIFRPVHTYGVREFMHTLSCQSIDYVNITPSQAEVIFDGRHEGRGRCKYLVLGGEQLNYDLVSRIRSAMPSAEIYNFYGPTEATIDATAFKCDRVSRTGNVPIGKPLPGYTVQLLTDHGLAALSGSRGEICIGGAGLARGYINATALTAEKFVTDLESSSLPLYKTGDLGQIDGNGDLVFLERLDEQVKFLGVRIELSEIETVLREHSAVANCAVVLQQSKGSGQRLTAFYQLRSDLSAEVDALALRLHLLTKLPRYMVPSAFVPMKALPISTSGKVDRAAIARTPLEQAVDRLALAQDVEQKVAAIWCVILNVHDISISDDFFDRGGTSLGAMRLQAKIHEAFGVELSMFDVFELPVLADFAQKVTELLPTG